MFERITTSLIAGAAVAAALAMAIFALGFALYALLEAPLGAAGAAASVAGAAALFAAIVAWIAKSRAERKRLEAEAAQARFAGSLPSEISGLLADRPLATLAVSLLGGFFAARYPGLVRDLLAAFNMRPR